MFFLYRYLNQQNTGHECNCIGANMNRTTDFLTCCQTPQPYLSGKLSNCHYFIDVNIYSYVCVCEKLIYMEYPHVMLNIFLGYMALVFRSFLQIGKKPFCKNSLQIFVKTAQNFPFLGAEKRKEITAIYQDNLKQLLQNSNTSLTS